MALMLLECKFSKYNYFYCKKYICFCKFSKHNGNYVIGFDIYARTDRYGRSPIPQLTSLLNKKISK